MEEGRESGGKGGREEKEGEGEGRGGRGGERGRGVGRGAAWEWWQEGRRRQGANDRAGGKAAACGQMVRRRAIGALRAWCG